MRGWLKWTLRMALALSGLFVLAGALAATSPGQRLIVHIAAMLASDETLSIDAGTLEGSLFSSGRLERITLSDRDGIWMDVRDVTFSWSPLALLTGKLEVEKIVVASVKMLRPPAAGAAPSSHEPLSIPQWPSLALLVRQLSIAHVQLGADVLGMPAKLRIEGQFDLVDARRGLSANMQVKRLEVAGGEATARLAFAPQTRDLKISLNVTEPAGGIIAHLTDFPQKPALAIALEGSGAIEVWRAKWAASAQGQPFAQGTAAIDEAAGTYTFQTVFEGYLDSLLPQPIAVLLKGKSSGSAALAFKLDQSLELVQASLDSDTVHAEASGPLDLMTLKGQSRLNVRIARGDGAPVTFESAGGPAISLTRLDLQASIKAHATARPVQADLSIAGLTAGEVSAATISATATATAANSGPLADFELSGIELSAKAGGVASPIEELAGILGADVNLTLRGRAARNRLEAAQFEIATAAARVTASGYADLDGSEFDVSLSGAGNTLPVSNFRFASLFDSEMKIGGRITRTAGGQLTLKDVRLANAKLDLRAKGLVSQRSTTLEMQMTALDLSAFDASLSGRAALNATAKGTGDDLSTKIVLNGTDLKVGGRPLDGLVLDFNGQGTRDRQAGQLKLGGRFEGVPLAGNAKVSADSSGNVSIAGLTLAAATAELVGHIDRQVDRALTGELDLRIPDLRALESIAGVALSGQASGKVKLGIESKAIVAQLRGDNITIDKVRIDKAVLDAADGVDGQTDFTSSVAFKGNKFDVRGSVKPIADDFDITIAAAKLAGPNLAAVLAKPGVVKVGEKISIASPLSFAADDGAISISGSASSEALDLAAKLEQFPAGIARAFDPALQLEGRIDGTIKLAGTPEAPAPTASLTWTQANYGPLSAQGFPSLTVSARASLKGDAAQTEVITTGPGDLKVTLAGNVPMMSSKAMSMRMSGTIPLSLANGLLAARSARAGGAIALNGTVSGTPAVPRINGQMTLEGATFADPESGLKLDRISGTAVFTDKAVTIDRITAQSARGGAMSVQGSVVLDADGSPVSDLRVELAGLKFDDRQVVSGEADGNLLLAGPLERLAASGNIGLKRLDVIVPSSLPKSIANLEIRHVQAPASISRNGEPARDVERSTGQAGIPLNIRIDAANRIFIKGRGLDAQLGGQLLLRGTSTNPAADGGFALERGRLSILGRQLEFKRGTITFQGSLEPALDLEASTPADDVTITVLIRGPASKPVFEFSSLPALPEDEVVARLLFNKALANLSPLQLVQLAGEVDKIGGLSSGPSTLDQLKSSLGIDVFDVTTDDKGATAVSAGSYVNDKTYVGVQQGTGTDSNRVVIDHDLTKSIKARGELGSAGQSKIGIGVEWDY